MAEPVPRVAASDGRPPPPLAIALAERGLSLADVADHLVTTRGLKPGSLVFAYGSLVEGLGNPGSDLDLCHIVDDANEPISPSGNVSFRLGDCSCDLMTVSRSALDRAIVLLRAVNAAPVDVRRARLRSTIPPAGCSTPCCIANR